VVDGRVEGVRRAAGSQLGLDSFLAGSYSLPSMAHASDSSGPRWPVFVGGVSFLYGIFYGSLYAGPQSFEKLTVWAAMEAVIAVSILLGGLGLIQHRSWSRYALLLGSYLVLGKLFCLACFLVVATSSSNDASANKSLLVVPLIVSAWPLFLVIWMWRPAIRNYIRVNWTRGAVSGASQ
jgi:hypothetical protein